MNQTNSNNTNSDLKMYYLNPHDYGEEYFTVAASKQEALENILDWLKNGQNFKSGASSARYAKEEYNKFKNVDVNTQSTFPGKYTLDEFKRGEVINSEIA